MDILVQTKTDETSGLPRWDFVVKNGRVQTLTNTAEVQQRAVVAAYIQKGTIPQLVETGVPWLEVVTGETNILEADAQIRANIQEMSGSYSLLPVYSVEKNKLLCTIQEA